MTALESCPGFAYGAWLADSDENLVMWKLENFEFNPDAQLGSLCVRFRCIVG